MSLGREVGLVPGHIVLDGDPAPPPPKGHSPLQFSVHVCCGQTAGWIKMSLGREVGLVPGHIVLDGNPAPQSPIGLQAPCNFLPMSVVVKRLDGSRCHVVGRQASVQATLCQMGTHLLCPKGAQPPPPYFRPVSVVAKRLDGSRCHVVERQASVQATLY